MEEKIRILSIISFLIIGLSHIIQPKTWIAFFKLLIKYQYSGAFFNGFITLPMGLLIVSFHNVWTGIPILLTIIGWCLVLKATIAFWIPALALQSMKRAEKNNVMEFRIGGIIFISIALLLLASFFA